MAPLEKAMVVSYRLSIVIIALSVTIRPQFAIECLRRSNQQGGHFGPKFRGVPLVGVAKSEHPRLTNGEINFEEFQPMWSQFTNVTDRQTTCDRNTALCTKVHRAVKTPYQLISAPMAPCAWNNWASATRSETPTSSFETYGLLTVLTLILWTTVYGEYCRNVFIRNLLKTERWWTEAAYDWSVVGIQRSVSHCQWWVCLDACVKAKRKHFEHMLMTCCSTNVNNLLWNLHYSFSVSQLLISHDF